MALAVVTAAAMWPTPAHAITKTDNEVQRLANFTGFLGLSSRTSDATRLYFSRVSAAYRSQGFSSFAAALPTTREFVELFGSSKKSPATKLKHARTILRRAKFALAAGPGIVLPVSTGKTIPDYRAIAERFVKNSERALKNLAQGKDVQTFLRKPTTPLWITNSDGTTFTLTNGTHFTVTNFAPGHATPTGGVFDTTSNGSYGSTSATFTNLSGDLIKLGAGTLTLSGVNTYNGTMTVSAGTLNFGNINSSITSLNLGLTGVVRFDAVTGYRWIAFPAGVLIPAEWSDLVMVTFASSVTDGTTVFPIGTHIVKAPIDLPLPDGAVKLADGVTLTATNSSVDSPFGGDPPTLSSEASLSPPSPRRLPPPRRNKIHSPR